MSDDLQPDSAKKRQTHRWRWQFSLRTLLLISGFSAVATWLGVTWWLRPLSGETKLPGGMSLWQEGREGGIDPAGKPMLVRYGRFALIDEHGRIWCRGQYQDGLATGRWTYFDSQGRTILSGECRDDVRTGSWTAWNDSGRITRKVSHGAPEHVRIAAHEHSMMGLGGYSGQPLPDRILVRTISRSSRDGPAEERQGGHRRAKGRFEHDVRHGSWIFYDATGRKSAEGPYRRGLRHGVWTIYDPASNQTRQTYFVQGREVPDVGAVALRLARDLESADTAERIDAIRALSEIGGPAVPHLTPALAGDDRELAFHALRAVARLGPEAAPLRSEIKRLADSEDRTIQLEALFALCTLDETEQKEAVRRLLELSDPRDAVECSVLHVRLARLGPAVLPLLEESLGSQNRKLRRAVMDVLAAIVACHDITNDSMPFQFESNYRVRLEQTLQRATQHADPKIAYAAAETLTRLRAAIGARGSLEAPSIDPVELTQRQTAHGVCLLHCKRFT